MTIAGHVDSAEVNGWINVQTHTLHTGEIVSSSDINTWAPGGPRQPESEHRPATWIERERGRDYNFLYVRTPWHYSDIVGATAEQDSLRFPHVCQSNPALLAYTESADKGRRDIQTPIKPGRYLKKFFSGILTEKQIAAFAEWWRTGSEPVDSEGLTLAFASTADEIERVYTDGPNSCMSGGGWSVHPARVYAAGDIEIAYLTDGNSIIGRAICWPAKNIFGRVYTTGQCGRSADNVATIFDSLLRKAGHAPMKETETTFSGARLALVHADNGKILMPYLDWRYGVNRAGEGWVMQDSCPEYYCDSTSGYLNGQHDEDEDEDEDPEYEYTCDSCEEGCHETSTVYFDRSGREHWCECCTNENAFYCEDSSRTWTCDSGIEDVEGRRVSVAHIETHQDEYLFCDRTGVWYDVSQDNDYPNVTVSVQDVPQNWCSVAVDNFAAQDASGTYRPLTELNGLILPGGAWGYVWQPGRIVDPAQLEMVAL